MHLCRIELLADQYPTRDHYPFNLRVLQETRSIPLDSPVTFFVGENGTGKSTLLEALARRCGIHIWEGIPRGRYQASPYEGALGRFVNVHWTDGPVPGSFFASRIFRHFAQLLDEMATNDPGQLRYFGGRSLMAQSHGESLLAFFGSRYRVEGLYLLDEPETALSPRSQIDLARLLGRMGAAGHAQFLIATHSPILMACPGATLYSFDHCPVRPIEYTDTEHYSVYRDFMADPGAHFDPE